VLAHFDGDFVRVVPPSGSSRLWRRHRGGEPNRIGDRSHRLRCAVSEDFRAISEDFIDDPGRVSSPG
jgi:hypothetical protein